jgi:hypothetical protein
MPNPQITGADMLAAVKTATRDLPLGSTFAISLFDSYDLFKLTINQLVERFGFEQAVAERVVDGLSQRDLTELGSAIGIDLVVDKELRTSLIANAGLIRSAGVWSHEPTIPSDPEQMVDTIRRMRNPSTIP